MQLLILLITKLFVALDCQEAIAWILVDAHARWQVASFGSLIFWKVIDGLLFTTAQSNILRI